MTNFSLKRTIAKLGAAFVAATLLYTPVPAVAATDPLAAALQPFVDQGEIAGAVALVANKNKILDEIAVGRTSLETERSMRKDDIFWIASMSKPMSGVAIGILVDEGKLSFDDPVSKFIPEFAARKGPDGMEITLRRLLTHTSGMGEQMTREPHLTLAETGVMAAARPLRYEIGARWSYSTLGIDVVGRVVEVASGMPLDRFLDQRLFRPLGMKNTGFWVPPADLPRLAHSYRRVEGGPLQPARIPYLYGTEPADRGRPPLIGAGLFSTAEDIVRVYQMMLNGGAWKGRRILRPETVAELTRKQTGDLAARPGMPWGLAFSVIEDPTKLQANDVFTPGSFGHGGAFGTSSWADPASGLVYVLMIQRDGLPNPDNSGMRIAFQREAAKLAAERLTRH